MSTTPATAVDKDLQAFEDLQPAKERTRIVTVTERKVAMDDKNNPHELAAERNVFVRPMPFKRWLQAMKYMTGILSSFPDGNFDLNNETQLGLWLMSVLGGSDDAILGVVSLATDLDPGFFDRIDLDDGVKITQAVVEVNKDFFVQKVLPMLSELLPTAKEKVAGIVGQTQ